MKILVTGAAGFIGSVVTEQLVAGGDEVVALDNLQSGHRAAVHPGAWFVEGDLCDGNWLREFMVAHPVDAVIHLAAEALIDERDPGRFYRVNVCGGLNLLEGMAAAGVTRLIFSSTAAVYGEPERTPIEEDAPHRPVNPYGDSKLAFERMLPWYGRSYGLRHISLRYFNACGASERYGQFGPRETHVIPILFEVALGQREAFPLFGTDYDTPDGTCIRDYVHVADIAQAHRLALTAIDRIGARAYNLGTGTGYSNRQVVAAVERVTGQPIVVIPAPPRPGDPARLVASAARIRHELGWTPGIPDLTTMVQTAWDWRRRHPKGYAS